MPTKSFDHIRRPDQAAIRLDAAPRVGDVVVEIGLVLAAHLAFALAVAFTFNAFGVS